MLTATNLADAGVRIASLDRTERDRAESESPQFRLARPVRDAAARGWLDGQDGQLPVSQVMFPRPCPQRLDDVGDMVSTGVRLPVSLSRARCLQLNLEARHVQARRIRVASTRRRPVLQRNHVPPGSPGAPQSNGVRRAVIEGFSFLEVPGTKTANPVASGRVFAVKVITACRHTELRGGHKPSEAVLPAPGCDLPPHWEHCLSFHSAAQLCKYAPYVSEVAAGRFRLITTGSESSLDYPFLIFRLMSQDCVNDLEYVELIFPWRRGTDCLRAQSTREYGNASVDKARIV